MPSDEAIRWTFCHRMSEPDEPQILEFGLIRIARPHRMAAVQRLPRVAWPPGRAATRPGSPGSARSPILPGRRTLRVRHPTAPFTHGRSLCAAYDVFY